MTNTGGILSNNYIFSISTFIFIKCIMASKWYRKYDASISIITVTGLIVTFILLVVFVYLVYRRAVARTRIAQEDAVNAAKAGCELILGLPDDSALTSALGADTTMLKTACRELLTT